MKHILIFLSILSLAALALIASTPQTITQTTPAAEETDAQRDARQVIGDADLALARFAGAIDTGFRFLWGTPESPRPREEVVAILNAMGAENWASVATRHAKVVTFLATEGFVAFEPWELTTSYEVTVEDGAITVGETLRDEWITE